MLEHLQLLRGVHPSWWNVLDPHATTLQAIDVALTEIESRGGRIAPSRENIFRSLYCSLDSVSVVIVGQDPYPTDGHAVGWSFSVASDVRPLPRSLKNIFREMESDVSCPEPDTGDLSSWVEQGVLLLNRNLTVEVGSAGSHRSLGWQAVTDAVVQALVRRERPLVGILWGRDAQELQTLFKPAQVISSPHPSPLSASRGFFGSKPFSRANASLEAQGGAPIDWCLK